MYAYVGVISVASWSIGPILSGALVSRFQMTPATSMRFVVICELIGTSGFFILMFIGCPQSEWAGTMILQE